VEQFANTWAPLLYLAAGILFILALRGLSSPATSRAGNRNGTAELAEEVQAMSAPVSPSPIPRPEIEVVLERINADV